MRGYLGFVLYANGDWKLVATDPDYDLLERFLTADYSDFVFQIIGW